MDRRQIEAFQESMSSLRKLMLQTEALGVDFMTKSRLASEAAVRMAEELSKREYSRLLFTNSYPELGNLSEEILNFSEIIHQIAELSNILMTAFEDGFLKQIQVFVHEDLGDIDTFQRDTWKLGDRYEQLLGRLLDQALSDDDRAHAPVIDARLRFELSRFEIVKYLNQLDAKKKFVFMHAMNKAMKAYEAFFEKGKESVANTIRGIIERDQHNLQTAQETFHIEEKLWNQYRARLEAELLGALPPPGAPAMAQAPISPRPSARPYAGILTTEVLSLSSQVASRQDLAHTRDEGVLKQGYLFPISSMFWAARKRKWYRLFNGNLYYISSPDDLDPKFCCDIRTCSVHARPDDSEMPFCFIVLQANGTNLKFQAENDDELMKWISAIRRCQSKWRLSSRTGVRAEVADKRNAALLEKLLEANLECAECSANDVEWASTSLGITLCADCAIAHRKLGNNISVLRSIYMDLWSPIMATYMIEAMGNEQMNRIWESSIPEGWTKPGPSSSTAEKEKWIAAKYQWFGFVEEVRFDTKDTSMKLAVAAAQGDPEQIMWCIAHKADVNWQDPESQQKTALHRACEGGHVHCVALLVQNAADIFTMDRFGRTALDLTTATYPENHQTIANLLTEKQQGELW